MAVSYTFIFTSWRECASLSKTSECVQPSHQQGTCHIEVLQWAQQQKELWCHKLGTSSVSHFREQYVCEVRWLMAETEQGRTFPHWCFNSNKINMQPAYVRETCRANSVWTTLHESEGKCERSKNINSKELYLNGIDLFIFYKQKINSTSNTSMFINYLSFVFFDSWALLSFASIFPTLYILYLVHFGVYKRGPHPQCVIQKIYWGMQNREKIRNVLCV
jgi:hypothetical protein